MCWVCIPTCGNCRPATKRMVPCPECGAFTLVDVQDTDRPKPVACSTCGADITLGTVPSPRHCVRYDVECGNPCGRSLTPFDGSGELRPCQYYHAPFERIVVDRSA